MATITQHKHGARQSTEAERPGAARPAGSAARQVRHGAAPEAAAPSQDPAEVPALRRRELPPDTGWSAVPIAPSRPVRALSPARSASVPDPRPHSPADSPGNTRGADVVRVDPQVRLKPATVLFGRYRLGPRMAVGGASAVYRAMDLRLGRPVAVKVLAEAEHDPRCADRFDAEASLQATLNHPRLVPLLDAGHDAGRDFLVMPLVEGPTLADLVHSGPVDPREVRRIGSEIADALAYVHAQDVVHRDVKPANVLLDRRGRVFLADFGAAHSPGVAPLVPPGMVIGTAGYLAPEQAMGRQVSPACDVYALGLVLLEALTGVQEYTGSVLERAAAAVNRPPRIPEDELGPEWTAMLRSLTAREPERRPESGVVRSMLRAGRSDFGARDGGMRMRAAA